MIGITGYGVYIPFYKLSRKEIGSFWGGARPPGEKAVANFDEDTVTMAVEACRDCFETDTAINIHSLYLSSASLPFAEKQNAVFVATALDLQRQTLTSDISGSLRSGTLGIHQAAAQCRQNPDGQALVAAADTRLARPSGSKEMTMGDGAAALALGSQNLIAEIEHSHCTYSEIYDTYRPAGDTYIRDFDERFSREKGYIHTMTTGIREALEAWNLQPADFQKLVVSAPNPAYVKKPLKSLGFDITQQKAEDPLFQATGFTGTAHPFLLLCAALENARPGERILWAAHGDGCDVFSLKTTEALGRIQKRRSIQELLESRSPTTYQKYLRWKNLVEMEPPKRPKQERASGIALYRDQKCGMGFFGSKCRNCGQVQYPVQRICMNCRARDDYEYYPLADKQGHIVTFSHDYLAVSPDPPTTLAAVDFEAGGRVMLDITDRETSEVQIGMPVVPTFRKFRLTDGIQVYWWKAKPFRK